MFEAETRLAILERLKTSYDEVKKTEASAVEGTFSFDTLAANAKEFEKAYAEMSLCRNGRIIFVRQDNTNPRTSCED